MPISSKSPSGLCVRFPPCSTGQISAPRAGGWPPACAYLRSAISVRGSHRVIVTRNRGVFRRVFDLGRWALLRALPEPVWACIWRWALVSWSLPRRSRRLTYLSDQNGKTKGHRLRARVTAKDKIPPPRGWAGHARVGRESGFGGKHIRDRTETPHRFLDEKVRVNART